MAQFFENRSCPHCGSQVVFDAVFCRNCGRRMRKEGAAALQGRGPEAQIARPVAARSPSFEGSSRSLSRGEEREVNSTTVVLAAALAGAVVLFIFLTASMNVRVERSTLELAALRKERSQLEEEYAGLQAEQADLESRLNTIDEKYNSLSQQCSLLQANYSILRTECDSLQTQNRQMESRGRQIQGWYDDVRKRVNLRIGNNRTEWRDFVTPTDASVESLVLQVTGGWSGGDNFGEFWTDVKKLYDWVEHSIEYDHDSPCPNLPSLLGALSWKTEYWRFPNETIQDKRGDCEDSAVLLCSLIRSYSAMEYTSFCILIDGDLGHAAVALPVENGKLAVLDPAGHYFTGRPGSLEPRPIEQAVNDWLLVWGGSDEAMIFAVFNEGFHKSFSSNQDFIDWATNR